MTTIDKIFVFDSCVDGNLDNFTQLINPMFDQFNTFYGLYKDAFTGVEKLPQIIFKKEDDETASFTVIHDTEALVKNTNKNVSITKLQEGHKIYIHSNNKVSKEV